MMLISILIDEYKKALKVFNMFSRKMNKRVIRFSFFIFAMLFSGSALSQLNELEIFPDVTSGIIQTIDDNHSVGIIQFKIIDFDLEKAAFIHQELTKYSGEVLGYGYSVLDHKILVSYADPMYPNFLLAILDRVNIKGYYEVAGSQVFYQKDGKSSFIF